MSASPMIEARALTRIYGSVAALDGTDFALYAGEVLAVVGDNGAGKSTLIKCLCGAEQPTGGEVLLDGQPVVFARPIDARLAGIETVHQMRPGVPVFDMVTSPLVGRQLRRPGPLGGVLRMLEHNGIVHRARKLTSTADRTSGGSGRTDEPLSLGQQQLAAVARAATLGSKAIILDEPTASLDRPEAAEVLRLIRRMRDRGLAVVVVSHNLREVFEMADRIHVQRLGKRAAVVTPHTTTTADVVAIMAGTRQVDETDQTLGPVR